MKDIDSRNIKDLHSLHLRVDYLRSILREKDFGASNSLGYHKKYLYAGRETQEKMRKKY